MSKKDYRKKHSFAVCAYKESEYLEECVRSLMEQRVLSNILIATSTPNGHISGIAEKYDIPLFINDGEKGITQDWNFAYSKCDTPYITIAHQDDVYFPDFALKTIRALQSVKKPLISFTDYCEIRGGEHVTDNRLLNIKRKMLSPLKGRKFTNSKFVRRRILSFGSPICCPSVTFVKDNLMNPVFVSKFRASEDWEAWEKISRLDGGFVYLPEILMGHRIHKDSETSHVIAETGRGAEDYEMFCKFWPKPIAKKLAEKYSESEKLNDNE